MTDPVSLPFVLNEAQINAAIAAELPRLSKDAVIDYVSGRSPNGLRATLSLTEEQIRQAITAHARKLVNPTFLHFAIDFQPTRGEDGLTASIIASTAPIAASASTPAATAAAPTASAATAAPAPVETKAPEPAPEPVKTAEAEPAPTPVEEAPAPVATDPEPQAETVTEAEAPAPVNETVSDPEPATAEVDAAPAPAAGRSRLFADLQRPKN